MPFNFSAAHSSRITKRARDGNPLLKRSSSSHFNSMLRRKPIQRSKSAPKDIDDDDDNDDEFFENRLHQKCLITCLTTDLSLRDVPQSLRYIRAHMFDNIPEGGGFNSVRIAEILNIRKSLPPLVTIAHLHALIGFPTATEREIAELTKAGVIRRVVVPGRGTGASSISDGLILQTDLENLLKEFYGLEQDVKDKFWQLLKTYPTALKLSRTLLSNSECTALMRAGFLTFASPSLNSSNVFSCPNTASSGTLTSMFHISRAASGSVAAVGGDGATHGAGNTGKDGLIRRHNSQGEDLLEVKPSCHMEKTQELLLALPNTGPYLKLLSAARSHLMSVLLKTKYRELPVSLLRERWDGGIAGDDPATKAKKYRGEFTGVLPGRTRKWKQYFGLNFEWVLAECLGAGLVEVFETGSVGRAVRVT